MTEPIGVPMAFAMSSPRCSVPHREPKPEVNVPTAGSTYRGRRAAAARAARSAVSCSLFAICTTAAESAALTLGSTLGVWASGAASAGGGPEPAARAMSWDAEPLVLLVAPSACPATAAAPAAIAASARRPRREVDRTGLRWRAKTDLSFIL